MKILITGSCGMLGQYICKYFKNSHKLYKTSKRNIKDRNYLSIDFLDFNENYINKIKQFVEPDIIIHTAALTNVDFCEKNPSIAKIVNYNSTKKLIDIFKGC
jgi:dTDP-4-dehydrorhamnose reductase